MLTNEPLLFGFTSRPILYSQNETDVQSLIAQLYIYLDNSNNGEINYATSWSSVKDQNLFTVKMWVHQGCIKI